MNILGINAYHGDSAAALVKNGVLVAAAEEERFRRIKHWAGFPSQAIAWCLSDAGITLSDVDIVAINQDSRVHRGEKLMFALRHGLSPGRLLRQLANRRKRDSVNEKLREAFPHETFNGEVKPVEHHMAHLSSAFHVSPFDEAMAVSVDGFGDFASAAWGPASGTAIDIRQRVLFPHSLGIFYQAMTQYLGFPHYGDEYKVMGLAPYGKPSYLRMLRQLVSLDDSGGYRLNLDYFVHHKQSVTEGWDGVAPAVATLYSPALEDLLGLARQADQPLSQIHYDLARSVQAMYEEAFFHLLQCAHAHDPGQAVVIAGGCGMNSVANGKIRLNTPYTDVYVQSAAGDAGGAIGAAYAVWHEKGGERSYKMRHAYLGPQFNNDVIAELLTEQKTALAATGCSWRLLPDDAVLCDEVAQHIAEGAVVGWFQGRMEWGPRALGNRSILGDPRRADMKDILNLKIKRRESFRPFAPSVLRDAVSDWFEQDADVPFMMQVFRIREARQSQIPAVTHVDGTGRLQTVTEEQNKRYHGLISAFHQLTGVPMLLNTSFNENEPVVCQPQEALSCFLRTQMDVLVMGNWIVVR